MKYKTFATIVLCAALLVGGCRPNPTIVVEGELLSITTHTVNVVTDVALSDNPMYTIREVWNLKVGETYRITMRREAGNSVYEVLKMERTTKQETQGVNSGY